MTEATKILQIGNYPPPMCGWAIQTKLVVEELRRRGRVCEILKINENRQVKSPEYVDVQDGLDYLRKVWRYAARGYRLNVHVNGMSKKGYWLALAAVLVGRLMGGSPLVTFHGGLDQMYFPKYRGLDHWKFYFLFGMAAGTACDSADIRQAIERYGIPREKVVAIATFSSQYLDFAVAPLPSAVEKFLSSHDPVIFSYVSFRPEYRLELLREAMAKYCGSYPKAGFIWLGFPDKELAAAEEFVKNWPAPERQTLLLLGNLTHDQFLTVLTRSRINLRTPACDGVAASVLESLALGVPVVASENGRRPAGVVTYNDTDAADMCAKLIDATEHFEEVRRGIPAQQSDGAEGDNDNVGKMADWLSGESFTAVHREIVAVR
jgi:glycosyltransferase involved in cell wall biosynthesis